MIAAHYQPMASHKQRKLTVVMTQSALKVTEWVRSPQRCYNVKWCCMSSGSSPTATSSPLHQYLRSSISAAGITLPIRRALQGRQPPRNYDPFGYTPPRSSTDNSYTAQNDTARDAKAAADILVLHIVLFSTDTIQYFVYDPILHHVY